MTDLEKRIETAAQLIHARRHRAGTGRACDKCRAKARTVVR